MLFDILVDLVASIGVIGGSLGYPAGLYFEKVGCAPTFLTAGILGFVSLGLLYTATYTTTFYSTNYGLLVTYIMVYGEQHHHTFLHKIWCILRHREANSSRAVWGDADNTLQRLY